MSRLFCHPGAGICNLSFHNLLMKTLKKRIMERRMRFSNQQDFETCVVLIKLSNNRFMGETQTFGGAGLIGHCIDYLRVGEIEYFKVGIVARGR